MPIWWSAKASLKFIRPLKAVVQALVNGGLNVALQLANRDQLRDFESGKVTDTEGFTTKTSIDIELYATRLHELWRRSQNSGLVQVVHCRGCLLKRYTSVWGVQVEGSNLLSIECFQRCVDDSFQLLSTPKTRLNIVYPIPE